MLREYDVDSFFDDCDVREQSFIDTIGLVFLHTFAAFLLVE